MVLAGFKRVSGTVAKTKITARLEFRLAETRATILESIADGACTDYPAYRFQCGYLRGIDDALAIMNEIEKAED